VSDTYKIYYTTIVPSDQSIRVNLHTTTTSKDIAEYTLGEVLRTIRYPLCVIAMYKDEITLVKMGEKNAKQE
jgi:hypothetical protein